MPLPTRFSACRYVPGNRMLFGTLLPRRRMRMRHPHCCPICNDFSVKTTLQDYAVTAKVKGEDREVSALAAYTCEWPYFLSPQE